MKSKGRSVIGYLVLAGLILVAFAACTEEKETLNTPDNYDYFPLEVGKYWVYEVDSIVFQNQTRRDSSKSWIKEQIVDCIIDNVGDTVYRVDQYERKNPTQPWQIRRVVSLSRNATRAIRTEYNIPLIKMVFPLHRRGEWSSTTLIDPLSLKILVVGGDIYPFNYWESRAKIEKIDEPLVLDKLQFSATTTVTYAKRENLTTNFRFAQEVYAKGIGLVKKDWQILDGTCNSCNIDQWQKVADRGFIIQQRLIDHN